MSALQIILNILLIISSLVVIVSVLMQSSESDGMGAISGNNDSFFGKAKNAALEAKLALATKISAGVFVALALVMIIVG
jgi:preprotein translocase subunit SecG